MQLSSSSDGAQLRKHDVQLERSSQQPPDDDLPEVIEQQTPTEQTDPFSIGATVCQRYRIESLLVSDEFALIYRARDLRWDLAEICTDVAIKVLRPELRSQPQCVARLKREFYQTRLIKHPNIVRMYGLDCHEGVWFIAMELLKGVSLAVQLRHLSAPLPPQRSVAILSACCDALEFAHGRRIAHGDLKPSNVFLLNSGGVRVLGFGATASFTPPAIGKATEELALPPPSLEAGAGNLLPKLPDARDDAMSLANLARDLFGASGIPRIANEIRVDQPLKSRSELSEQARLPQRSGMRKRDENAQAPVAPKELVVSFSKSLPVSPAAVRIEATKPIATQSASPVYWKTTGVVLALGALGWILSDRPGVEEIATTVAPQSKIASPTSAPPKNTPELITQNKPQDANTEVTEPTSKPVAKDEGRNGKNAPPTPAALPKQEVSFGSNAIIVSSRASAAVLTLKRSNGREGRLRVNWKINAGTAVAGRDFSGPTSGSVVFADWQIVKALYIPLVAPAGNGAELKKFTVEITDVSNGARIAPTDTVTVNVRDFS